MRTETQILDAIECHVMTIRLEKKRVGNTTVNACVLEFIHTGDTTTCWGKDLRDAVETMILVIGAEDEVDQSI